MRLALAIAALLLLVCPAFAASIDIDWQSTHNRNHRMMGLLVDDRGKPVAMERLGKVLREADFVLLGEQHDNPDHHTLQARFVRLTMQDRSGGTLVLEMVPTTFQHVLDAPEPLDTLGDRLAWAGRGWGDFSIYRPIFEAALAAGMQLKAGNFSRESMRSLVRKGADVLTPDEQRAYRLDAQLPEAQRADLLKELEASHCGLMPAASLAPMAIVQRARDGLMAVTMREADKPVILIAGRGHVRRDRGVPALLDGPSIAIGMVEIRPGMGQSGSSALEAPDGSALYDYTLFTPAFDISDPCVELRKRFGKTKTDE